jgi:hypothetical protein
MKRIREESAQYPVYLVLREKGKRRSKGKSFNVNLILLVVGGGKLPQEVIFDGQ